MARVKICLTTNNQQKILADLTGMTDMKFDGIAPRSLFLAIAAALLSLANPWLATTAARASTFAYEGFDYKPEDRENSFLNGLPGQSGLDGGFGWLPYKNESPSATHFQTAGLSYTDALGNRLITSARSGSLFALGLPLAMLPPDRFPSQP